jgi:hypothetical protein
MVLMSKPSASTFTAQMRIAPNEQQTHSDSSA